MFWLAVVLVTEVTIRVFSRQVVSMLQIIGIDTIATEPNCMFALRPLLFFVALTLRTVFISLAIHLVYMSCWTLICTIGLCLLFPWRSCTRHLCNIQITPSTVGSCILAECRCRRVVRASKPCQVVRLTLRPALHSRLVLASGMQIKSRTSVRSVVIVFARKTQRCLGVL